MVLELTARGSAQLRNRGISGWTGVSGYGAGWLMSPTGWASAPHRSLGPGSCHSGTSRVGAAAEDGEDGSGSDSSWRGLCGRAPGRGGTLESPPSGSLFSRETFSPCPSIVQSPHPQNPPQWLPPVLAIG